MTIAPSRPALVPAKLAERLLTRALKDAPPWAKQVSRSSFCEALERSVASRFREEAKKRAPSLAEIEQYVESLHAADLALACACAEGAEAAWEHFVRTFRPDLYAAARAVARDANPHELADSIYAELFGLEEREGKRRSLFQYFHGRSKLSTWLRAIVAQRFVDQIRAARRTVSLDDSSEGDDAPSKALLTRASQQSSGQSNSAATDLDRSRLLVILQAAVQGAIGALEPRERLRLSYYYVQDLTLAQIGRLLKEHEATVSRKLDRTRAELRSGIEATLWKEKRLSDEQVRLCFQYAQEEWPFDLSGALSEKP